MKKLFSKSKSVDDIRIMNIGDAVIYKNKTHYIRYDNEQVILIDNSQGACGINGKKTPLTKIIQEKEITDMYGNKVFIPYSIN